MAAGQSKKLTEVDVINAVSTTDRIVVCANSGTLIKQSPVSNAYSNVEVNVKTVVFNQRTTPANSTANVAIGTMWFDSNYLYVATANNVIKRVALTSF